MNSNAILSSDLKKSTIIPLKYQFHLHTDDTDFLIRNILELFPEKCNNIIKESHEDVPLLLGEHTFLETTFFVSVDDIYIHNVAKCSRDIRLFQVFSFETREKYEEFHNKIHDLWDKLQIEKDKECLVYRYDTKSQRYKTTESMKPRLESSLVGHENVISRICKDVESRKQHHEFLTSIGEGTCSLNYMLYGPPGTGKTSAVRVLATKLSLPIYIVNPNAISLDAIHNALSPDQQSGEFKILLMEDFDRFLETPNMKSSVMSQILNSLDGFDDNSNIIRFFSANNPTVIQNQPALLSRMTSSFHFDTPDLAMLEFKLATFMKFYGKDWKIKFDKNNTEVTRFCQMCIDHNVSFRVFSSYIIQHLFAPSEEHKEYNPIDAFINNIHQLGSRIEISKEEKNSLHTNMHKLTSADSNYWPSDCE